MMCWIKEFVVNVQWRFHFTTEQRRIPHMQTNSWNCENQATCWRRRNV